METTTATEVRRLADDDSWIVALDALANGDGFTPEQAEEWGDHSDPGEFVDETVLEFYVNGRNYGERFWPTELVIVLGTGGPHYELTIPYSGDADVVYGNAYWGSDRDENRYLGTFEAATAYLWVLADAMGMMGADDA